MDHITGWLEHLENEGKSPHTLRSYRQRVKLFQKWFEDTNDYPFTPENVTPTDLREYKSYLQNIKNNKAQTVNVTLNAIVSWLDYHDKVIKTPPRVKTTKTAPQSLNKKDKHALLRAVERSGEPRDIAIVTLLLNTGLRVSEASDLNIEDLVIGERSGLVRVLGKGDKERIVPLNNDARKALKEYIGERASGPLFLSERGRGTKRLTAGGIYQLIDKYAYQAKLPHLHPHILRHTFAKELIDAGVDISQVAELLGHSSLDTTRIYTQPTIRDLSNAVEKISIE